MASPGSHEKSPVTESSDVVRRYQQESPALAQSIAAGNPGLGTFVMDLCLIGDQVAIVEINKARNCGLYALKHASFFDSAVAEARTKRVVHLDEEGHSTQRMARKASP